MTTDHEAVPPVHEASLGVWRRFPALRAAVRLAVGAAVIALLVLRGDTDRILSALAGARVLPILGAFAVILAGLVVSAFRWQAFLRPLGISLRMPVLLRLYFVGMFFNAFLPTGVGGDAYKAMRLRTHSGSGAAPIASVLLDRIAGLVGLAVVGLCGVAYRVASGDGASSDRARVLAIAAALSAGALLGGMFVLAVGDRILPAWLQERIRIVERLGRMLRALSGAGRDARAAVAGVVLGVLFQGCVLASHILLARSLGLGVPAGGVAAVVVLASVATMIPVTINGLGFREGAYVWGLAAYGVAHEQAVAFALLVLATLLASSGVGGLVYVAAGGDVAPDAFDDRC